ncbi:unnamed protein product [Penicillium salamii]|uniref:Uncharacterized protein n=1 Tax=Penicillium salamii TaxID=1612424 RepID=A0A9W4INT2_9EURO|nr:unnamed protein product [Penicillium salamii]CAG8392879.1 unnamed protein product [Penicillium salamii]CAG8395117.1 unnamed protein product [Penicillium salamii]CAG8408612.1 unnamed protein product [Penicillium salamii]
MTTPNSPEPLADAANGSVTYGTRSRGRNAPRPNYAEDRDLDMDADASAPSKAAKRNSGVAPPHEEKTSSAQRKSLNGTANAVVNANASANTNGGVAKEAIPGTSSFSARPEDANGSNLRKRKQPSTTTPTSGSAKKIFTSAPGDSDDYFTNMMSFETHGPYLHDGQLIADDGTTFSLDDHVYLICEPPGEPYYLARIMEFIYSKTKPGGLIESLRVNWYYRPRDIQRHSPDTRYVFASMHSDPCPLSSLRGKCDIRHSTEIEDVNTYKKTKNSFWYDKMFDRYIHRLYDVIPTKDIINVPGNVKKVLDERWRFILVEIGKGKELTGAVKTCKRCRLYAANSESVDCAVCHSTYHMHCVRPALTKKPARGFAWACAACSRAQERKLEARNTPLTGGPRADGEDVVMEEEEEEDPNHANGAANGTSVSTPAAEEDFMPQPATAEQMAQAKMWPYRYLGIHCRVEDALDYDDRIYPRASSRLGTRHQAMVAAWPGRAIEYVKPLDKKKSKVAKKDGKSKDAQAALEAAKHERANRPKWVQDEPTGYIHRGLDEPVVINEKTGKQARTAEPIFKMPTSEQIPTRGEDDAPGSHLSDADREKFIDDYMRQAKELAPGIGVEKHCTNFLDKALQILYAESFNVQAALVKLKKTNRYKDLKEPHIRPEELKLFEQGVAKYGSEWRNIMKHVKTVPIYQIVRFYYMWKKTPSGRKIWGAYEGRRGKKEVRRHSVASSKLLDDVADDHDDSAFDSEKAVVQKRGFQCKFCETRSSRQWRRAPLVPPGTVIPSEPQNKKDKGPMLTVSLCLRCALLWRKYGIQYEDVDEVAKRIANSGNKSWRRRIDEEMLAQLIVATETPFVINNATASTASSMGIPLDTNPRLLQEGKVDPTKKKIKETPATSTATSVEPMPKKKAGPEKVVEAPPIIPDPPKAKTLPCAICTQVEPTGEQLSCRDCRLTVHRNCYGISNNRVISKWLCDMCSNDRSPSISTNYSCVLCPVSWTEHDLMETPKNNSRKKTERDKEKERMEKEMVTEAIKLYRQRQEAVGKPVGPREPLKRTAGNNWAHVLCTLWMPELKYGDAAELEPAEGFGSIPKERWRQTCKICKSNKGACLPCSSAGCDAHFHVGCAFQAKYHLGLNLKPAKPPRGNMRESGPISIGEDYGIPVPVIYCPNHTVPSKVHGIGEKEKTAHFNALQYFAQAQKQADKSLTGTVRKAAYMQQSVGAPHPSVNNGHRRASTSTAPIVVKDAQKVSTSTEDPTDDPMDIDTDVKVAPPPASVSSEGEPNRKCVRCATGFSPRWWSLGRRPDVRPPVANGPGHIPHPPGFAHVNGDLAVPVYECHKCHIKNPAPPPPPVPEPTPDARPSPYGAQRTMVPTTRMPSHGHGFLSHPHSHPPPSGVLGRPMPPAHAHGGIPGQAYTGPYEQRPTPDNGLRNGLSSSPFPAAPPPHHMNNYPHPHPHSHPAGPPQYTSAGPPPPPPPYATHQSPYGPVPARSPHLSQPPPRTYAASASPPIIQATTVNRSPQTSLSALNGGPPPRMYSVDRGLAASSHSPPVAPSRLDPRGPTPPTRPEDTPPSLMGGLPSAGRTSGVNGTGPPGTGASASPSLKNLLS